MDHSTHVTLGGFLAGLVVGFGGGVLYAVFRRAWADLAGAKRGVTAASKGVWGRTFELVVLGFALAVIAALALGGIAER